MKEKQLQEVYIFKLERTIRQLRKYKSRHLKALGLDISSEQWVILKRLSEQSDMSQRELAKTTYKDPAAVTRTLDLLQKKELLERKASETDRRLYLVSLSRKGKKLVKDTLPEAVKIREKGTYRISKKEIDSFLKTLDKIYENFSD